MLLSKQLHRSLHLRNKMRLLINSHFWLCARHGQTLGDNFKSRCRLNSSIANIGGAFQLLHCYYWIYNSTQCHSTSFLYLQYSSVHLRKCPLTSMNFKLNHNLTKYTIHINKYTVTTHTTWTLFLSWPSWRWPRAGSRTQWTSTAQSDRLVVDTWHRIAWGIMWMAEVLATSEKSKRINK